MSRILLAWELGGALGHISILLPVARCLRQRGHEVLFAVKNVGTARQMLDDEEFRYVQSPLSHGHNKALREPASFADILAEAGFAEEETLGGLARAWENLFDIFRPDMLLAQYAPSAQLAARLVGLPCLSLNMGFERPPEVTPFPCFRPWLKLTKSQLLTREEPILANINKVFASYGAPPQNRLYEALKADITLLATLPELDHYHGRKGGCYIGPLSIADDGVEPKWPEGGSSRIFTYLRPDQGTASVLEALAGCGASVIAYIPGIDGKLLEAFSDKRLLISTSKVKLSPLLPDMDLAVTHGNHGTIAAALLAGVPLLSIPTTIEQWMLKGNVERQGAGIGVRNARVEKEFSTALDRLLSDGTYRTNAKKLAKKYEGYDQSRVVERIANTLERMANPPESPFAKGGLRACP